MKVLLWTICAFMFFLKTAQGQQCPPDAPAVSCFIDPCTSATCPDVPGATCTANYCGECSARWYSGSVEVTSNCSSSSALPQCPTGDSFLTVCNNGCTSNSSCSPGQICCRRSSCATACVTPDPCAMIACDVPICPGGVTPVSDNSSCCPYCPSPCAAVSCLLPVCANGVQPTVPEGECCPQCPTGNNGTESASCPTPQRGTLGTCDIACTNDSMCPESQLCCSNGCGWACMDPVTATCTGHDGRVYQPGQTFRSGDGCNNCTCTSTGLSVCTLRACPQGCVDSSGKRHAVGQNFTAADGCNTCVCLSNENIACTEIYCPPQNCPTILPDSCNPGQSSCACSDDQICCSGCCVSPNITCLDSDGNVHQVNETFMAADGCNTCTCTSTGLAACTRRACPDTCSLPPESGLCDAYFPSYYFNRRTRLCERFVYGGCGGNDNRFRTAGECYRRCNSSSQCIQPTYPEDSLPLCLVVVRKWAFNSTSGLCVPISYSSCGQESEGYNVFDTQGQCNRTCISAEETCPNGEPMVQCFADPCSVNSCPGVSGATCRANYCGGCYAYFYDANGNNVTDQCSARALPTPRLSSVCPMISNTTQGLCAQLCTSDTSCSGDEICCSNGCGHSCIDPERIPYYDIPRQCPDSADGDLTTGSCVFTNNSCLTADTCGEGELCCQSGCGRRCLRSVVPSQPCFAVADQFIYSGRPPAGLYIPSCDADNGTFVPVQCHPSTGNCWCVNTRTGQPISSYYPRGIRPTCPTCSYGGRVYSAGDSFPSTDGCNRCICSSGFVACTLRACIDTCSLPPETGSCRGYFPAYYYNRSRAACLPFVYGGCQGNNNKFQTIRDCLGRCNRTSRCLQDATICIDPAPNTTNPYTHLYGFNATSGQCERIRYGCSSLPVFSNLSVCQSTCNPGSVPDICAAVRCAAPNCTRSRWVTDPGACCPRCRPPDVIECRDNEFRCNSTLCIPTGWVCDGLIRDCPDGRDESARQCPRNGTCTGHLCGDGVCIPSDYVCDDYLDCRDASDEANCTSLTFENTYYPDQLPTRCPNSTGLIGTCVEECNSDNPCRDNLLCCSNGCGRSCLEGQTVAPLCPSLARQQYTRSRGGVGAFIPQCEADGSFSSQQCWASTGYCWCVETTTGRPISEGTRGDQQECTGCTVNGVTYPHGERFTAEDGCNTCYCMSSGMAVCTREACAPVSCMVLDREIPHGQKLQDACSNCLCKSGQLNCTRTKCATTASITQKAAIRVTMGFVGDLDQVTPTDEHKENLKREVMKTLLNRYKDTLGLVQEQISDIELKAKGGITIGVTITDSQNVTFGANITLVVGQMQQDYQSNALVIRYNRAVLEPSGEFQVDDGTSSGAAGFPWWGILIIAVGALVIVVAISVVIMGVVIKRVSTGRSPYYVQAEDNDYGKGLYKNSKSDMDMKVNLDGDM